MDRYLWYLSTGNLRYKSIKRRVRRRGNKEDRGFQNLENAIQDFLTYPGVIILCQKSGPFPQTNSMARIRGTNESTGFALEICFTANLAEMHPFRKAQQIHMELKDSQQIILYFSLLLCTGKCCCGKGITGLSGMLDIQFWGINDTAVSIKIKNTASKSDALVFSCSSSNEQVSGDGQVTWPLKLLSSSMKWD